MNSRHVEHFDELMNKITFVLQSSSCTQEFIDYVKWIDTTYVVENKNLKQQLEDITQKLSMSQTECSDKDRKLSYMKLQINQGKIEKANIERERNKLRNKLKQVTNLLLDDRINVMEEETRATISRITSTIDLNTPIIYSRNHSIFSELSFSTESTDDISEELLSEDSFIRRKRKIKRTPKENKDPEPRALEFSPSLPSILKTKRVADNTGSSEEEFHSLGETPCGKVQRVCFATYAIHNRQHNFVKYKCVIPHKCSVCSKLMSFQSDSSKCDTCKQITHNACQREVPLPCVPAPQTPTHLRKTISGNISAYTPFLPPMIPGLVIHCINAVENMGLEQENIYKFEGHPEQIKDLLKELTNDKKSKLDNLIKKASIHSICSALKEFLLCLDENLVPSTSWPWFADSLEENEARDIQSHLYAGIAELPQPNRDTLAYIMLHLQRVAESSSTKMSKRDLAQIFGPILIGTDNSENISASSKPVKVLEFLLDIPADYWNQYIVLPSGGAGSVTPSMQELRNTPTSDMALVQTISRRGLTTPYRTFTRSEQKKRFFKTPVFQ